MSGNGKIASTRKTENNGQETAINHWWRILWLPTHCLPSTLSSMFPTRKKFLNDLRQTRSLWVALIKSHEKIIKEILASKSDIETYAAFACENLLAEERLVVGPRCLKLLTWILLTFSMVRCDNHKCTMSFHCKSIIYSFQAHLF